jgi:GNAT superfamily N-acetyltransferase
MDLHTLRKEERGQFEKLRRDVFGDDRDFLELFEKNFSGAFENYVICENGSLVAALTQFSAGRLVLPGVTAVSGEGVGAPGDPAGPEALISYAICTDKNERGHGYGSRITAFAREIASERNAVSLLSPAEPALLDFYEPLGYAPLLTAEERTAAAAAAEAEGFRAERLAPSAYGRLREKYLAGRAHIALSPEALEFVRLLSPDQNGLFILNDGEAICACEDSDGSELVITEIVTNGMAGGDSSSAAYLVPQLARALGKESASYTMPAQAGSATSKVQGMAAWNKVLTADAVSVSAKRCGDAAPYFGFTFG